MRSSGTQPLLEESAQETQRARRGILMPRGKNCRETIFAAQLLRNYPHHGGNFEREKNVLCCGGEAIWEAFYETTWARVIESQKLPRESGESIFAARHQDASQGPLGRKNQKFNPSFLTLSQRLMLDLRFARMKVRAENFP